MESLDELATRAGDFDDVTGFLEAVARVADSERDPRAAIESEPDDGRPGPAPSPPPPRRPRRSRSQVVLGCVGLALFALGATIATVAALPDLDASPGAFDRNGARPAIRSLTCSWARRVPSPQGSRSEPRARRSGAPASHGPPRRRASTCPPARCCTRVHGCCWSRVVAPCAGSTADTDRRHRGSPGRVLGFDPVALEARWPPDLAQRCRAHRKVRSGSEEAETPWSAPAGDGQGERLRHHAELLEDLEVRHVRCRPDKPEEGVGSDRQLDRQELGSPQGSVHGHGRGGDEPGPRLPQAGGEARQQRRERNRVGMGDAHRESRQSLGPGQSEQGSREILLRDGELIALEARSREAPGRAASRRSVPAIPPQPVP